MKTKNSRHAHWANQLIFLSGLLFGVVHLPATSQTSLVLRSEVHKPLLAAQDALKNNQPEMALNFTKDALSVANLTSGERATVLRLQAVAGIRATKWNIAKDSLNELLGTPDIAVIDRLPLLESLMNVAQQSKDNALLIKSAKDYLKLGGLSPAVRLVMIQTLSLMGDHAKVVSEMTEKMHLDSIAGVKTPEQELRILAVSYRQLKDNHGYQATLRRLLENYPTKAYWAEVIQRMAQQTNLPPRAELDLYRLLEHTNNLEEVAEYLEMAELAIKAGLPAEAVRVLSKGFELGVLGQGGDAAAHKKTLAEAQKKVQEDAKGFALLEKNAKDATAWTAVADVYFSQQNWSAAHLAYARALELGGSKRENELRLHDAISLIHAGQKDSAKTQLSNIKGDAFWVDVAGLWSILTR